MTQAEERTVSVEDEKPLLFTVAVQTESDRSEYPGIPPCNVTEKLRHIGLEWKLSDWPHEQEVTITVTPNKDTGGEGKCERCQDERWLCDECNYPPSSCEHGGNLSLTGCPDCSQPPREDTP